MDSSDLAKRMKKYEAVQKGVLMTRTPVIIRIDGKAFHTFTRGFQRPFDKVLIKAMQETTKYLCENIQGCVLGYTQSDEISLVLVDYRRFETSAWFDYEIQKMCSIAASMATMTFNKCFEKNVNDWIGKNAPGFHEAWRNPEDEKLYHAYLNAYEKGAMFDARVFNIPKEEVTNCIYWRQLDASRNSVQMVGQANFSHNELQGKSCNRIQDMLMTQKNINWNDFPVYLKRGSCCVKEKYFIPDGKGKDYKDIDGTGEPVLGTYRSRWIVDKNIPIFSGDGRRYIDDLVFIGD